MGSRDAATKIDNISHCETIIIQYRLGALLIDENMRKDIFDIVSSNCHGAKLVIFAKGNLKSSLYASRQSGYGRNYRGGPGGYGGFGEGEIQAFAGRAAVVGGADGGGQGGV